MASTIDYVIPIPAIPKVASHLNIPAILAEMLRVMGDQPLSNMEVKLVSMATEQVAQEILTLVGIEHPWEFCTDMEATLGPHDGHKTIEPTKITPDAPHWKGLLEKEMQAE
jgi:hypothetical protein